MSEASLPALDAVQSFLSRLSRYNRAMGRDISIVVGAVIVALAIVLTNHWSINTLSDNFMVVARLNRWTGTIEFCAIDAKTIKGSDLRSAKVDCDPK